MADRPDPKPSSDDVIRRIVLELQAQVRGQNQSQRFLNNLVSSLRQAQNQATRFNSSMQEATAGFTRFYRAGTALGSTLRGLKTPFAALTGAVAGLRAVIQPIIQDMTEYGDIFNKVAVITGANQKAVENLVKSYTNLHNRSKLAMISIKELGDSIMKYASQGFLEFASSAESAIQGGIANIKNALAGLGLGDTFDRAMMDLGKNGGDLMVRSFVRELGKINPNDLAGLYKAASKYLPNMAESGYQFVTALQRAADAQKGLLDPLAQLSSNWNSSVRGLMSTLDQLTMSIWEALGPTAVKLVGGLTNILADIQSSIKANSDIVVKFGYAAHSAFVALTKALAMLGGTAADAFGLIAQGLGVITKYGGKMASLLGIDGIEEGGEALQELGKQSSIVGRKLYALSGMVGNMSFDEIKDYIQNASKGQERVTQQIENSRNRAEQLVQNYINAAKQAHVLSEEAKNLSRFFDAVASRSEVLSKTLREAGAIPELESQLASSSNDMLKSYEERRKIYADMVSSYQQMLSVEREQAADPAASADQRARALGNIASIEEKLRDAEQQNLNITLELAKQAVRRTAARDRELDFAQRSLELIKQQKEAYSLIMGVPGMGLEAIKQEYEMLSQTVSILQRKREEAARYFEELLKGLDAQIQKEQDVEKVRKLQSDRTIINNKRLETQQELTKQIRDYQLEQLRATKELREGYLQAIDAMAVGAGKFEKFLITQERNMGRGMRQGMARPTPLIGEVGKAAAMAKRLGPVRWSGRQFGQMEDMRGQNIEFNQFRDFANNVTSRMSDDTAKYLMQSSSDLMNTMRDTSGKTNNILRNILDAMTSPAARQQDKAIGGMARRSSNFAPGFTGVDPVTGRYITGGASGGTMLNVPNSGFSSGGFTGRGSTSEPAGLVHKGEIVFEKKLVDKYGPELLRLRGQMRGGSAAIKSHIGQGGMPEESTLAWPMLMGYGLVKGRKQIGQAGRLLGSLPGNLASRGASLFSGAQNPLLTTQKQQVLLWKKMYPLVEDTSKIAAEIPEVGKGLGVIGKTMPVLGKIVGGAGAVYEGYKTLSAYQQSGMNVATAFRGAKTATAGAMLAGGPVGAAGLAGLTALEGAGFLEQHLGGHKTSWDDDVINSMQTVSATLDDLNNSSRSFAGLADAHRWSGDQYAFLMDRATETAIEISRASLQKTQNKNAFWTDSSLDRSLSEYIEQLQESRQFYINKANSIIGVKGTDSEATRQAALSRYNTNTYVLPNARRYANDYRQQFGSSTDALGKFQSFREEMIARKFIAQKTGGNVGKLQGNIAFADQEIAREQLARSIGKNLTNDEALKGYLKTTGFGGPVENNAFTAAMRENFADLMEAFQDSQSKYGITDARIRQLAEAADSGQAADTAKKELEELTELRKLYGIQTARLKAQVDARVQLNSMQQLKEVLPQLYSEADDALSSKDQKEIEEANARVRVAREIASADRAKTPEQSDLEKTLGRVEELESKRNSITEQIKGVNQQLQQTTDKKTRSDLMYQHKRLMSDRAKTSRDLVEARKTAARQRAFGKKSGTQINPKDFTAGEADYNAALDQLARSGALGAFSPAQNTVREAQQKAKQTLDNLSSTDSQRRQKFAEDYGRQYGLKLSADDLSRGPVTEAELRAASPQESRKLRAVKAYHERYRTQLAIEKRQRESANQILSGRKVGKGSMLSLGPDVAQSSKDIQRTNEAIRGAVSKVPSVPTAPSAPGTSGSAPQSANPPSPDQSQKSSKSNTTPTSVYGNELVALLRAIADNANRAADAVERENKPGATNQRRANI